MLSCAAGVSAMFHTYISPEVYELFVKEVSAHFGADINRFKTGYDCVSCLVGVVIGEFIGARNGLGYLIIYGSQVFQLDLVILSILILCLMAMLLYGGVTAAEKLYHRRQHA